MKDQQKAYAKPAFSLGEPCRVAAGSIRDWEVPVTIAQIYPESTWSRPDVPEYSVRVDGAVILVRETELSRIS